MSISHSSSSLRTWKRLSFQLHALKPLPSIRPGPLYTATTSTTTPIPTTVRQFHYSHRCNAARSPSVRRAKASRVVQPAALREPRLEPAQGSSETRKKFLDENGASIWAEAVKADVLDEKIELGTFMRIAHGLYERAYMMGPSAEGIWELDSDADKVFNIGQIASVGDPRIKEWLLASCALADARMPILICTSRYLTQHKSKTKSAIEKTPLLDKVESLALQNNDPIAMTLHAQALGLRGRYKEAIPLIEKVMQSIKPEASPPTLVTGGFLSGFTPPWEVYEWLKLETGDHAGAAEAVKLAATEYDEPKALVAYAKHVISDKKDFETFEECMSKAASAGNPEACQKLADFYLLTSIGLYPHRGDSSNAVANVTNKPKPQQQQQEADENESKGTWLTNLFNRSLSRSDYRKLARNWYELACLHGSHEAALTFSLILRGEGDYVLGKHYLDLAAQKPDLLPVIRGYRVNWENRELELAVDYKRLEIC